MRNLLLVIVLGILALLTGCREYYSKAEYFDGAVIVEYNQSQMQGTNDYLTLRFYEAGEYKIEFSITPEKPVRGQEWLPENRTITIDRAPWEKVIEQYILPDFLRVTVTRDGKTEHHDFS